MPPPAVINCARAASHLLNPLRRRIAKSPTSWGISCTKIVNVLRRPTRKEMRNDPPTDRPWVKLSRKFITRLRYPGKAVGLNNLRNKSNMDFFARAVKRWTIVFGGIMHGESTAREIETDLKPLVFANFFRQLFASLTSGPSLGHSLANADFTISMSLKPFFRDSLTPFGTNPFLPDWVSRKACICWGTLLLFGKLGLVLNIATYNTAFPWCF